MRMVETNAESQAASELLAHPRSKMIEAFRSMLKDAGVDGAKQSLSVKEISMALGTLGYGQQEIECVFKQIDLNGKEIWIDWFSCTL